jgi:two-component system sensor histidine kinase RegB
MPNTRPKALRQNAAESSVRLRTLILLRWVAIVGQAGALVTAAFALGVQVLLVESFLVISLSVLVNLVTMQVVVAGHRPGERVILGYLTFDLVQLVALLALTGGLNNPFALLVIVPVTIAATALSDRSAMVLGALTISLVSLLALLDQPLTLHDGAELRLPALLSFGFWLAIVIGVAFLALYTRRVSGEIRLMSDALLAAQMALAREQKLTDLGGVVAAAAHELGTPLATIKLASTELIDEISDRKELAHLVEDAALIRSQADRCRDILQSMGRAGKDDLHLRHAPFETVLREAAEPHAGRGKLVVFSLHPSDPEHRQEPTIRRAPELIHGLRNLVQNAVDFATSTVWVEGYWDGQGISVIIADDGPGYPPQLLGRIGEPYLPSDIDGWRDYKGMGLGLFIAKTLLERSGAQLSFGNGTDPFLRSDERPARSGAIVEASWPLEALVVEAGGALGPNERFGP